MAYNYRLDIVRQQLSGTDPLVKYKSRNQLLTITLNRPKALNSLNLAMINDLSSHVSLMNQHQAVWLQGAGGKAFCAGGDVKVLFEQQSTIVDRLTFFRNQFTLDYRMSQLNAVQISCWDGIVMGGGVGLSVFAPVIIATEKTVFAMPETKLGFFTDVGASYILSRMRSNIGYYLGLTGNSLRGEQVFIAGLANFYIPSGKIQSAYQQISQRFSKPVDNPKEAVTAILSKYHAPSGKSTIAHEHQISLLFSLPSGKEILNHALSQKGQFYSQIVKSLKAVCPVSIELVHKITHNAKKMSLKECFIKDFEIIQHMVVSADFKEGVRCVLKEKGAVPKWSCPDLSSVTEQEINKFLKPICWSQPLQLE